MKSLGKIIFCLTANSLTYDFQLISVPFQDLGLDIQDEMGRHEVGFVENTVKSPIGEEGCLFEAHFNINKVPGRKP